MNILVILAWVIGGYVAIGVLIALYDLYVHMWKRIGGFISIPWYVYSVWIIVLWPLYLFGAIRGWLRG